MENPIEPLFFVNASPVVPALLFPMRLNHYCNDLPTKARYASQQWPRNQAFRVPDDLSQQPHSVQRRVHTNTSQHADMCLAIQIQDCSRVPKIPTRNVSRNGWQTLAR